jgi:hypothetical protein
MNGLACMITGSGRVEGLSGQIGLRETGACPRVGGPPALACWSMQVTHGRRSARLRPGIRLNTP